MRRAAIFLAALLVLAPSWSGRAALAAQATPPHSTGHAQHNASAMEGMNATANAPEAAMPHAHPPAQAPAEASPAPARQSAEVSEKVGQTADLDVTLVGEDGTPVRLRDLVTMPTVIAPVYYSCPNECNVLLGTLSQVLPQVGLKPGAEYQVLAVSFDDRDTPKNAASRKSDFLDTTAKGFPPSAWRFLTGDEHNVRRLMDSLGFGYTRVGDAFRHSVALIVLTPSGKISRYLYGIRPLAFDIAMAATEAGAERTGLSVKRAIAMCYTYDPQGRRYVFDLVKVAGAGILAALALFGLFLAFGGKKRGQKKK
jgi:protein SCO1/2